MPGEIIEDMGEGRVNTKTIVTGQIYRVQLTSKNEYAVVGTSVEDVRLKFTFVVDVSAFDRYRIDSVAKESDRCCLLRHASEWVESQVPDGVINRLDGTASVFQKVEIDSTAKKYSVYAKTICFANDEKQAIRKFRRRTEDDDKLIEFSVEELFAGDGLAHARDISMFPTAKIIGMRR